MKKQEIRPDIQEKPENIVQLHLRFYKDENDPICGNRLKYVEISCLPTMRMAEIRDQIQNEYCNNNGKLLKHFFLLY